MNKQVFLLVVIIIAISGCSTQSNSKLTKVTISLDYTPNTNHTGLYVADSLGYYEDMGIDLEIIEPGAGGVEQVVATNQVDFGISYEDYLASAVNNDLDLKALATITNHSTVGAISRKDRGLTNPSTWAGATFCGWGTPIENAYIKNMAKVNGVNPDSINYAISNQTFLADTNTCDIFWGYQAWENAQATIDGIDYNFTPASDIIDYYPTIIITSDKLIADNPKLVADFMDATKRGYEYAAVHPDEAASIFLQANPEFDQNLIQTSQQIISSKYLNSAGEFGYIDQTTWQNFSDFMIDNDIINEQSRNKVNEAYTNQYLEENNVI